MKTLALLFVLLVGAYASSLPLMDLRLPKNVSASNVWALLVAGSNGYDNYRHQVGWPVVHLVTTYIAPTTSRPLPNCHQTSV